MGLPVGFLGPAFFFTRWLVGLALLLLVVALFPGAAQSVAAAVEKEPGKSLLVGLLTMLAAIPVRLVLLITLIGPVVWAFFLVVAGFFGKAAVTLLIGRRVREAIRKPEEGETRSLAWDAVIGSVALGLASLVPLLGGPAIWAVRQAAVPRRRSAA